MSHPLRCTVPAYFCATKRRQGDYLCRPKSNFFSASCKLELPPNGTVLLHNPYQLWHPTHPRRQRPIAVWARRTSLGGREFKHVRQSVHLGRLRNDVPPKRVVVRQCNMSLATTFLPSQPRAATIGRRIGIAPEGVQKLDDGRVLVALSEFPQEGFVIGVYNGHGGSTRCVPSKTLVTFHVGWDTKMKAFDPVPAPVNQLESVRKQWLGLCLSTNKGRQLRLHSAHELANAVGVQ